MRLERLGLENAGCKQITTGCVDVADYEPKFKKKGRPDRQLSWLAVGNPQQELAA